MAADGPPKKKTNKLLKCTQRELLEYRERPGEYDNDEMLAALATCASKDELTDEETGQRADFITLLEAGRNLSWIQGFLAYRDSTVEEFDAPFSASEVAVWIGGHAENVDIGNPQTENARMDVSRKVIEFFMPIITTYLDECVGHGLMENVPPNRYRATEAGAELFWDDAREL